jgi:hypothetical protein
VAAFVVVAIVVVAITVSAARARPRDTPSATQSAHDDSSAGAASKNADAQLAAALAPLLATRTGNLAVGVIDRTTGTWAVYNGPERFHTASIVKADILAALLLRHQAAGTSLSPDEQEVATQMIEASDNDAAQDLWNDDDAADGIAEADAELGLRHTTPGAGGYWGLTSTTIVDQLLLLTDLVSDGSPLTAASRSYELGLMRHVEASEAWGVTKAATPGTVAAVKNGWLPDPRLWVINSIGVIWHGGQLLLVAVLSNDQPSEAAGIAQDEAAAVAAADAVSAAQH